MNIYCDFHIHSDLSPCAEADMTPGNIVGMAMLNGLQAIALTDHQSCGNCAVAIALSEQMGGPLVLPGMEVESQEEIHLICLFPELAAALEFEKLVRCNLPDRPNRPEIFGEQHFYDVKDEIVGKEDRLLLQACRLSCDVLALEALSLGGVCIPAHIDRDSYSMLAVFGMIPPDFPSSWLELSCQADESRLLAGHPELSGFHLIRGSDAHRLENMASPGWLLEVSEFSPDRNGRQKVIQALRH